MKPTSESDAALVSDLNLTLGALDSFFAALTANEWTGSHGDKWAYSDVPVHVGVLNGLLARILRGEKVADELIATQRQINAFNDAELARLDIKNGADALAFFRENAAALTAAIDALPTLDTPVFLPILRARGWYTARLGVEYIAFHNWLHLAEAHLRLRGTLPDLPERIVSRAVDFYVNLIPGALNRSAAQGVRFNWRLTLTGIGGGTWTVRVADSRAEVVNGAVGAHDFGVTASVETFFAATYFRMRHPLTQFLLGRLRVNPAGLRKIGLFGSLFNAPYDQEWPVFEREQTAPPA